MIDSIKNLFKSTEKTSNSQANLQNNSQDDKTIFGFIFKNLDTALLIGMCFLIYAVFEIFEKYPNAISVQAKMILANWLIFGLGEVISLLMKIKFYQITKKYYFCKKTYMKKWISDNQNLTTTIIALTLGIFIITAFYFFMLYSPKFSNQSQEYANFSTYFNGLVAPMVTFVGLIYIINTFKLQDEQLQLLKTQNTENTTAFANQLEEMRKQHQENKELAEKQLQETKDQNVKAKNSFKEQLSEMKRQHQENKELAEKQLQETKDQNTKAENSFKEQLQETKKQGNYNFILSSLNIIHDIINKKIEQVFSVKKTYNPFTVDISLDQESKIFQKKNIDYFIDEIDSDFEGSLYNLDKNVHQTTEIFKILNSFVKNILQTNDLDNSKKEYFCNLLLQGRLEDLKEMTKSILENENKYKNSYLEYQKKDNENITFDKDNKQNFKNLIEILAEFKNCTNFIKNI